MLTDRKGAVLIQAIFSGGQSNAMLPLSLEQHAGRDLTSTAR
jgi:hypothetical protein